MDDMILQIYEILSTGLGWLVKNKDLAGILIGLFGVFLTVLGWIAVFWLGLRQQKRQLRNTAMMKVYEELFSLKEEVNEKGIRLGTLLGRYSLPFLHMGAQKLLHPENHQLEAHEVWREHVRKVLEAKFEFVDAYRKLWSHSEMWMSTIPKLKTAKEELFHRQFQRLGEELYRYIDMLNSQSTKEFNWELWDRESIENEADNVRDLFNQVGVNYVDDYLGLIHNRLVTPLFGYKKIPRENHANMDKVSQYTILTEKGIEEINVRK